MADLRVNFCGVELKNPITTASGTFGFGHEYGEFFDLSQLGGIGVKGLTPTERLGNPAPRIAETPQGILNCVGLQNPGIDRFIEEQIPFLRQYDTKIIANVSGNTVEEYEGMVEKISDADVDLIEMNISCPNVKCGGMAFGTQPKMVEEVVSAAKAKAKKPLIVKLSPNVTDIAEIARAAESAGADALSLINTLLGMRIDIEKRKPILSNVMGGLSGPVVAVVAVIGTLVAAFMNLWNTNEEFRTAITVIWNDIVSKVKGFCDQLTQRINGLGFDFKDVTEVLKAVWDGFCQVLAPLFEGAFSYDGYQVVRKELFAHLRDPAIVIRKDSITFNTACITGLEDVVYVHVMFNSDLKRIVVRGCDENDKDALRWCIAKPDKRKSRKMTCKPFSELVYKEMGWDTECRYKMLGYRISFEGETLYVFDLLAPEIFHEGQKRKNGTDQKNAQETKSANTRKGFYPDDIVGTFGVPVEEHLKESEVQQMDGYVSVGMLTGKTIPDTGLD